MAFVTLEDLAGSLEVVVFPSVYAASAELLGEDRPIMILGKVQQEEKGTKLIADTIIPMEKAEALWTAEVHFHIDLTRTGIEVLERLRDIVRRHPGDCKVFLHLHLPEEVETLVAVNENWGVQPGDALNREIHGTLDHVTVETQCAEIKINGENGGTRRKGKWQRPNGNAGRM
jgi:DNA polymerase III subunit alpha